MSDLVSNATRGVLAEYLVGRALEAIGLDDVRTEWDAYDLVTPEGLKIEVKSSAFVQAWEQRGLSRPIFSIRSARGWSADSGTYAPSPRRDADVYVFALLAHRDQSSLDPTDVGQWEFYVLPTAELESRFGAQKTLSLSSLRAVSEPVGFTNLRDAVRAAVSRGLGTE